MGVGNGSNVFIPYGSFFFNDTATTEIYTLSLHDALPIWLQAYGVSKNLRCVTRDVNPLRQVFMQFSGRDINGQPLPNRRRTDDRYELFYKFQGVLKALGFDGVIVLVDRVDEPHLMGGSLENMKAFVWSMLDNKFLKQPGLGLKLLLPIELSEFVEHENHDFFQRARLDKQNMIPSLEWTGQSLHDLANARVAACAAKNEIGRAHV